MENFKAPKKFLFKEGAEDRHLHTIFTDLGKKPVYDSAAQCNKCAYCSRVCPAQLETNREDNGPRARNLLLRFIMEGKLDGQKDAARVKEVLSGCMLCGLCTKECFAKVPAHEHVLELERTYGLRELPAVYRLKTKMAALKQTLKRKTKNIDLGPANAFFLPSFEAKFLETESALNMLRAVQKIYGGVKILWSPSGAHEYVYSKLPAARAAAQKLTDEYFAASPAGDKKIITDSLDIFNFIKKYPQIFWGTENFERAQKFAANVFFIADVLPALNKLENFKKIIFTKTAAFSAEDNIFQSSINLLSKNYPAFTPSWIGENYPIPPLGYERVKPKESAKYLRRKIDFIKAAGADAVVTPTMNSKRLLNKHLKKYYPDCRALYIGDLYADK